MWRSWKFAMSEFRSMFFANIVSGLLNCYLTLNKTQRIKNITTFICLKLDNRVEHLHW